MKRSMVVLMVVSATFMLPSQPSWAGSCVQATPKEHAAEADVIFTGTATDPESNVGVVTYWTSFEVEIVYKGTLGPEAAVETGGGGASAGIDFIRGERYTVFARAQEDGLDTNSCMGTAGGQIEPRLYGLTPRPISADETRFAPEDGTPWWLWIGVALGSILLLGAGVGILGRRSRSLRPASRE
jgi:hypothetical protein